MTIKVISPEKVIYESSDVKEVLAPTTTGEIGILPKHQDLISNLKVGELIIKKNDSSDTVLLSGGLLQVKNDEIIILADEADLPDALVKAEIEEAIRKAESKLSSTLPPTVLILIEKEIMYQKLKYNKAQL